METKTSASAFRLVAAPASDALTFEGRMLFHHVMQKQDRNTPIVISGSCPTNGAAPGITMQQPYRVLVVIEGVAPILFRAWNCEAIESKSKAKKGSAEKKSDDLESFVYRDDKGHICIPGIYLTASIINAAKFQQDPRSPRKSACDLFKAGVFSLTGFSSLGKSTWDFVDKRRMTVMRNGITRSRPGFNTGWRASFILLCNLPEYIDPPLLNSTIAAAGRLIGIADGRPTYGRFVVVEFKVLDD